MRYLCKKTYYERNTFRITFIEGHWYEGYVEDIQYFITDVNGEVWTFNDSFHEYFYTLDEHREMEINKILM
tara:strand:+ start:91 stop:303 length:213 start_codon:yes stop_codon:yes gene_type:complete